MRAYRATRILPTSGRGLQSFGGIQDPGFNNDLRQSTRPSGVWRKREQRSRKHLDQIDRKQMLGSEAIVLQLSVVSIPSQDESFLSSLMEDEYAETGGNKSTSYMSAVWPAPCRDLTPTSGVAWTRELGENGATLIGAVAMVTTSAE
ncbi:hypothetical protein Bbelb_005810 [Branchiostoma belcheri]|nr:hypothetical protein Bbelb_005810 [Branchiostoma belcheri]